MSGAGSMTREELRDYVDEQRTLNNIPYHVYSELIDGIDTLEQELKIGHWIRWYERKENDGCIEHIPHCKCSECGRECDPHSSQFIKYCSECGAKMQESEG